MEMSGGLQPVGFIDLLSCQLAGRAASALKSLITTCTQSGVVCMHGSSSTQASIDTSRAIHSEDGWFEGYKGRQGCSCRMSYVHAFCRTMFTD